MVTKNIKLSTIDDVRTFVNTVSKYDADIDLKSGRYTSINPSSIRSVSTHSYPLQLHTNGIPIPSAFARLIALHTEGI